MHAVCGVRRVGGGGAVTHVGAWWPGRVAPCTQTRASLPRTPEQTPLPAARHATGVDSSIVAWEKQPLAPWVLVVLDMG